jgi:hypothetical protein
LVDTIAGLVQACPLHLRPLAPSSRQSDAFRPSRGFERPNPLIAGGPDPNAVIRIRDRLAAHLERLAYWARWCVCPNLHHRSVFLARQTAGVDVKLPFQIGTNVAARRQYRTREPASRGSAARRDGSAGSPSSRWPANCSSPCGAMRPKASFPKAPCSRRHDPRAQPHSSEAERDGFAGSGRAVTADRPPG